MASSVRTVTESAAELLRSDRFAEALAALEAAEIIDAEVLVAKGIVLRLLRRFKEAADAFQEALRYQPLHAQALTYLGMLRLQVTNMESGWVEYQHRWRFPGWPTPLIHGAEFRWTGQVVPGRSILLWCEQGYGDAIQFARYVPWLRAQGMAVWLECPDALAGLFQACWPEIPQVRRDASTPVQLDCHLPLLDFPAVWKGRLPPIPRDMPYLFSDISCTGSINTRPRRLRVGITWTGRPTHPDDRFRSIEDSQIATLIANSDVSWVFLHPVEQDRCSPDFPICTTSDFLHTARIIANLDLVISVDSAVAHLAGAMGKSVWLLVAAVPDWRWGTEGSTTPWYPNTVLYRQLELGCWGPVLGEIRSHLAEKVREARREGRVRNSVCGAVRPIG